MLNNKEELCPYCKHKADFEVHPEGFKVCRNCRYVVCMPEIAYHKHSHVYTDSTEYPGKHLEEHGLTEF